MKLYIKRVRSGPRKGDLYHELRGANGEFINGSRPETFQTRQGLEHNIALLSQIKEAEIVDLTREAAVPLA